MNPDLHGGPDHCTVPTTYNAFEEDEILVPRPMRTKAIEDWPNTAACLVSWRRVTQQGVILYVIDCPCRLP